MVGARDVIKARLRSLVGIRTRVSIRARLRVRARLCIRERVGTRAKVRTRASLWASVIQQYLFHSGLAALRHLRS